MALPVKAPGVADRMGRVELKETLDGRFPELFRFEGALY